MREDTDHAFSIRAWRDRSPPVVAVVGSLDLHAAPELRTQVDAAIEAGDRRIVVDLTDATFIDSMALGILLHAHKRLRERSGHLLVACPDPHLRRVFEITALDRVLDIADDNEYESDRSTTDRRKPV